MNYNQRSIQEIEGIVNKFQYDLLDNYISNGRNRRVIIIDKNGYKYDIVLLKLIKGQIPFIVHKKNPYSLENIRLFLVANNRNFELCNENNYIGTFDKLKFRCLICNCFFNAAWTNISRGQGCPKCKKSKGERIIENFLLKNKIEFFSQYKFDNCKNKQKLSFDFYIEKYNLCIEFNGMQHYKEMGVWGGKEKLERSIKNDKIKCEYCLENNISLLIIPYTEIDDIEEILLNKLNIVN